MVRRSRRTLSLPGASLGFLLGFATLCRAGDVCLQPSWGWGCFPCDVPIEFDWVGYGTAGPPCRSPGLEGPGSAAAESVPDRGWWRGLYTLSASDTDPFDNEGPLPVDKVLSLWLASAGCGYGFSSGNMELFSDTPITSYTPVVPGSHAWTPSSDPRRGTLEFVVGCIADHRPLLIGKFSFSRKRSDPFDAQRPSWGFVKSRWRTGPGP
jgi:hypothetical protein